MTEYKDKLGRVIPADHFENEASPIKDASAAYSDEFNAWIEGLKKGGAKSPDVEKPNGKKPPAA